MAEMEMSAPVIVVPVIRGLHRKEGTTVTEDCELLAANRGTCRTFNKCDRRKPIAAAAAPDYTTNDPTLALPQAYTSSEVV